MEFTYERNMALMDALRQHLMPGTSSANMTVGEIFRRVVATPCRRFWVSEERAAVVIGAMLHKGLKKPLNPFAIHKDVRCSWKYTAGSWNLDNTDKV